jgi:glycosyltransferase involved in cell wall biosynthesis
MSDTWLVIPAYNVEPWLGNLLDRSLAHIPPNRTLVIDDGSCDATARIASERGVQVIHHKENLGKGAALRSGLRHLLDLSVQWAITMDGDLQHDPDCLPRFLEISRNGGFDLIIGERPRNVGNMPCDRRFSNWSSSLLLSIVTGVRIRDAQCGFRAIRLDALNGQLPKADRYEFETELLLQMASRSARIGWVPIPTKYHGSHSSINRFSDTLRFLGIIMQHLLKTRSSPR